MNIAAHTRKQREQRITCLERQRRSLIAKERVLIQMCLRASEGRGETVALGVGEDVR